MPHGIMCNLSSVTFHLSSVTRQEIHCLPYVDPPTSYFKQNNKTQFNNTFMGLSSVVCVCSNNALGQFWCCTTLAPPLHWVSFGAKLEAVNIYGPCLCWLLKN